MNQTSLRNLPRLYLSQLFVGRWRRVYRTTLVAILVGLLAGLAARGLESLVSGGFPRLIGRYVDPVAGHDFSLQLPIVFLPALGGLFSGIVVTFLCRSARAHGTAVLIEAFHERKGEMSLRDAALKAVAAAVVISCGGSVGKEAAIAVLGAAIGAKVATALRLSARERRIFLTAGCAAGVGAIFQTPQWLAAAIAGLLCGLIALGLPQIMDAQYKFIQGALDGTLGPPPRLGFFALFVLVVLAKCLATALMMGAESAGGLFGPVVFMGGVTGAATGAFFHAAFPSICPEPLRAALIPVGMAGVLAAALRTPLAATIMVTEMTGSYGLIVPLMLVSILSYAMGRRFGVYAEQVRSSEESPAHAGDLIRGWLVANTVSDLVRPNWPYVLRKNATLPEIMAQIPAGARPVFLVMAAGRVAGFISPTELAAACEVGETSPLIVASDIMNRSVAALRLGDDLYAALERFHEASVDALPVVERDGKTFAGVLERSELLAGLREHVASRSAAAMREHTALSSLANDVELDALLSELGSTRTEHIVRMKVPEELVGVSLRQADFRYRYGAQVLAIETAAKVMHAPPDPHRPLDKDDVLIVMPSEPTSPPSQADTASFLEKKEKTADAT